MVTFEQWEMDVIPKDLKYNILFTNFLSIYSKPALNTINCFSKNSQLHTQCIMIRLAPLNIFCEYDLEIIKNEILKCDQCHLSQYIQDGEPYHKVILIEVEVQHIPDMITTVDENKNIFKSICGEEMQSMEKIPIPELLPIELTTNTLDSTSNTATNILPADFDENFATNFENIHILVKFNHLKFSEFNNEDHRDLRQNIKPIFEKCFDPYKSDLKLEGTTSYIRSYDTISYRDAFQISFVFPIPILFLYLFKF